MFESEEQIEKRIAELFSDGDWHHLGEVLVILKNYISPETASHETTSRKDLDYRVEDGYQNIAKGIIAKLGLKVKERGKGLYPEYRKRSNSNQQE